MSGSSGVRGFFFADLRGYTRFVERHGDAAAADLLRAYRDVTRDVIGRHSGAEIRTEGDGIYVVFASVVDAVDAGVELVDAAAELTAATPDRPIRVAVGIHAGETEAAEEGPVGSAINIAARICAIAEPGEVLVSGTVRDLVRTARPYRATALGVQRLKGVDQGIPVHRVEATPSGRGVRLRRQARARRRVLVIGALAIVAVVTIAAGAWAASRPPDCLTMPTTTDDAVLRIDPLRGCVIQVVDVGDRPGPIVEAGGALWVGDRDGWTITRLDPVSGTVAGWLGVPGSPISVAATSAGDVVVLTFDDRFFARSTLASLHELAVISGAAQRLERVVALPSDLRPGVNQENPPLTAYSAMTVAGGRPWIVGPRGTLARIDIAGGAFGHVTYDLSAVGAGAPALIAAGGATVWIADRQLPSVYRFDSASSDPRPISLGGKGGTTAMAVAPEAVWLLRADGSVTRLDPVSGAQTSLQVEGSPTSLVAGDGVLWLLDQNERVIRAVDPLTGATRSVVDVGGPPAGLLDLGSEVWVTVAAR